MRAHGLVQSAAELGLHGHACWTYDDETEFIRGAGEFLADGIRLGQRLMFVGPGPPPPALAADFDLAAVVLDDIYTSRDPEHLLGVYGAATDHALADGFTGLRIVADVTSLPTDPAQHARWEAIADRFMATRPMAALCCYDARVLGPETIDDLCAVHPASNGGPRFHVYAEPSGLAMDGEVDFFSAAALRRALVAAGDGTPLDLTAVTFADHHGMLALAESGLPLRGIPPSMRRVCELMGVAPFVAT
jgi:hypothetical protein